MVTDGRSQYIYISLIPHILLCTLTTPFHCASMSPPNDIWKYFKKGKNHYATHKEAWCTYCIDAEVSSIRAGELDAEQVSADAWPARTEEAIWETCEYQCLHYDLLWCKHVSEPSTVYVSTTAICGKVDALLAHLSKHCWHVPTERKEWAAGVLRD